MAGQEFTAEMRPKLAEWFDYNLGSGCTLEQLKTMLVGSGFREGAVDDFLATEFYRWSKRAPGALFDAEPVSSAAAAIERFWQRAEVLDAFNRISVGDRTVPVLVKDRRHGIYFIPGFLSDEECEKLISDAGPLLSDSRILDESDGAFVAAPSRSSRGALLERDANEVVRRIESRLSKLTSLPVAHGEGMQILRYSLGGEYHPHFDFFDPASEGGRRLLARGGQRLASVIMYLCDVEAGGTTEFPELSLEFAPLRGAALLFPSIGRDGALLRASLHAGRPVTSGEKWIATKWIRVAPYLDQGGLR